MRKSKRKYIKERKRDLRKKNESQMGEGVGVKYNKCQIDS